MADMRERKEKDGNTKEGALEGKMELQELPTGREREIP
jgi:hypothetical protein